MTKSARLRSKDYHAIFQLAGECQELGDCPISWRKHWYAMLAKMVGAEFGAGGEEKTLANGRSQITFNVEWGWESGFVQKKYIAVASQIEQDLSDLQIRQSYFSKSKMGTCVTRTDIMDDSEWYSSFDFNCVFGPLEVNHSLLCAEKILTQPDFVSVTCLYRPKDVRRDFSPRDRRIVEESTRLIVPMLGGALARPGTPSPLELPPRVREVLKCILEGDGDKQIAKRLGISRYTVNEYAKVIYRHFGVGSRTELMARWVRRNFSRGPSWEQGP